MFSYSKLIRVSLVIAVAATSVFVSATSSTVKLPLDIPAPPDPRAATERAVAVAAIDRAAGAFVAVGPWGRIIVTRDGGKTWTQSAVPVSSDLTAVHFPTPQNGWAVGHDGVVLHSADGGKTWERQLDGRQYGDIMVRYYEKQSPENSSTERASESKVAWSDEKAAQAAMTYDFSKMGSESAPIVETPLQKAQHFKEDGADKPFLDVWFEDDKSGWVIGAFNLILKTSDGGKTWEPWVDRIDNEKSYNLYAIGKAGDDVFIVGELGLVCRLDRALNRFVKVEMPATDVFFKSPFALEEKASTGGSFFGVAGKPGVVVVYGLGGKAFRSRDGGKNWEALSTGIRQGITGGTFLEDGRLVLASSAGYALLSRDDGTSFSRLPLSQSISLNAITQLGGDTVIVATERGVKVETIK